MEHLHNRPNSRAENRLQTAATVVACSVEIKLFLGVEDLLTIGCCLRCRNNTGHWSLSNHSMRDKLQQHEMRAAQVLCCVR